MRLSDGLESLFRMSKKRIFFAADEKLLAALCEPLRKTGLSVETFGKQADLVPAARIDPPDAMLLSARLTDGTALATFQALQQPGKAPPTVAILTPSQLGSRGALLKAGIADIAISPIRPKQLGARLIELAGGLRRAENKERLEVPATLEIDGRKVSGTTIDASRESLGISLTGPVSANAVVSVTLQLAAAPLTVLGRIMQARVEGDRVIASVQLLAMSADEENSLLKALPGQQREVTGKRETTMPVMAMTPGPKLTPSPSAPIARPATLGPRTPPPAPVKPKPSLDLLDPVLPPPTLAKADADELPEFNIDLGATPLGTPKLTDEALAAAGISPLPKPAPVAPPIDPNRWPQGVPSLLASLDALRIAVEVLSPRLGAGAWAAEAIPPDVFAGRSFLESEALSFGPKLTTLEREAFDGDSGVTVADEGGTPGPAYEPTLDANLAGVIAAGAAQRFRVRNIELSGREALALGRREQLSFDDDQLRALQADVDGWAKAAQRNVDRAIAAGDDELGEQLSAGVRLVRQQMSFLDGLLKQLRGQSEGLPAPAAPPPEPEGGSETTARTEVREAAAQLDGPPEPPTIPPDPPSAEATSSDEPPTIPPRHPEPEPSAAPPVTTAVAEPEPPPPVVAEPAPVAAPAEAPTTPVEAAASAPPRAAEPVPPTPASEPEPVVAAAPTQEPQAPTRSRRPMWLALMGVILVTAASVGVVGLQAWEGGASAPDPEASGEGVLVATDAFAPANLRAEKVLQYMRVHGIRTLRIFDEQHHALALVDTVTGQLWEPGAKRPPEVAKPAHPTNGTIPAAAKPSPHHP